MDEILGCYKKLQVIMARGLCVKFKIPVFIDFDQRFTPEILNDIITSLHNAGYIVVYCVCDNATENTYILIK